MNVSSESTRQTGEMMWKVGLEAGKKIKASYFASRLRHAVITIHYVSHGYYTALY